MELIANLKLIELGDEVEVLSSDKGSVVTDVTKKGAERTVVVKRER